jgi:hypothetical protein
MTESISASLTADRLQKRAGLVKVKGDAIFRAFPTLSEGKLNNSCDKD